MDTREKIISIEQLSRLDRNAEWVTVAGFFDPLTAAQAARLAALGGGNRNLLAVVLNTPDGLLTVDARAALVASLRGVNAVVRAEPDSWRSQLPDFCASNVVDDCEADRLRTADFIDFVLRRQRNGKSA